MKGRAFMKKADKIAKAIAKEKAMDMEEEKRKQKLLKMMRDKKMSKQEMIKMMEMDMESMAEGDVVGD
jgi:hypothetical protein